MIEHIEKRALALLLAVLMVFSMVPTQASAAGSRTETGSIGNIGWSASISTTTDGATDLGGVTVDGTTMTITAQAESVWNEPGCGETEGKYTYNATSTTVTFTNSGTAEAIISFDYTPGNKLEIDGTEYTAAGSYASANLAAGGTVTVKFYSPESGSGADGASATLTLTNIKWTENAVRSMTVKPGTNGTVSVAGTAITANKTQDVAYAEGLAVSAAPASGYKFLAWVDENNSVLATTVSATLKPDRDDMVVSALFVPTSENGHWLGNKKIFTEFQDALDAAASGDKIVKLMDNASLTKSYTIPAGVSVLIPFDQALTAYGNNPEVVVRPSSGPPTPKVYCTLTMAAGVTLTVNGNLEVGAKHVAAHGGQIDGGRPWEYYGYISMGSNSHIDVQSGGNLYAWGYITGSGKVTANSGATIYEKFMIGDYRGGGITSIIVPAGVFPFNQYYVQNVEVQETIHPGANLICHAGLYLSELTSASINFIGGTESMFSIASGTISKRYDNATDRLIIDMNGNGAMNPISLMDYNTGNFVLPVNHNITVNVNSGVTQVNQDLMLQPGAEVNVGREGYLVLSSGKKVYLIDKDNWGNYCFGKPMQQISYVPLKGAAPDIRTADNMTDARVNLDGTAVIQGQLYASTAGALIESEGKTGVVILMNSAPSSTTNIKQSPITESSDILNATKNISVGAALLTNGDGTTVNTKGAAQYTTYVYDTILDKWVTTAVTIAPTLTYNANGGTGTDRTKTVNYQNTATSFQPLSVVAESANAFTRDGYVLTGWNTAADGTGKAFAPGDFITISQNHTLYAQWRKYSVSVSFAAGAPEGTTAAGQMDSQTLILDDNGNSEYEIPECKYSVEGYTFDGWLDADGNAYVVGQIYTVTDDLTLTAQWAKDSAVISFNANAPQGTTPSGAMADQIVNEGDKLNTNAFAVTGYTFKGWNTASDGTGTAYADGAVAPAESITLYAQWEINTYTITWIIDGKSETTTVNHGEVPTHADPTKAATVEYSYEFTGWTPAVVAATGNATYTAQFKETPNNYTITYVVDGTEVHEETYAYGAAVTEWNYTVAEGYNFSGWNAEIPATMPAKDLTFTGTTSIKTYTITWIIDSKSETTTVNHGEVPTHADPTKAATAEYSYEFTGWTPNVVAATGNATYTAQFKETPNNYTITYVVDGTEVHEETYAYGAAVTEWNYTAAEGYNFSGWDAEIPATMPAKDLTFTGTTSIKTYTITWIIDGESETTTVNHGQVPTHADPTKAATAEYSYEFTGWTPNIVAATGNATYTAQFEATPVIYTITFEDGKGNVLLSENYTYGQMPTAPADPTRADEDGYKFVFAGWDPAVVEVTEDATYTATWTKTRITYTISFDTDGDGEIDVRKTVAHGDAPEAPDFSKADTAEWDYTFTGWRDSDGNTYTTLPAAYGAETYTAVYEAVKQVYTITWIIDGVTETTTVAYGEMPTHADPTKAATVEFTYKFTGWTPALTAVTGDATYTAKFEAKYIFYTATIDYNGGIEKNSGKTTSVCDFFYNELIPLGAYADYASREGYTLVGWNTKADGSGQAFNVDKDFSMPAHDVTIYAQWKINEYTITWMDDNSNVLGTTTVNHGDLPTYADPSKDADVQFTYEFAGWSPAVVEATGDATYSATFTPVLRSYDITFVVDGQENKVVSTKYGETPVYDADGKVPVKESDVYYSYEFAGWTPALESVTGEATYTATWTETPVVHTITFKEGNEVLAVISGNYGDAVDMTKVPATDRTGYTFMGWSMEIPTTMPAGNTVITGSWMREVYAITFKQDPNFAYDDNFAYSITKYYGEAITQEDLARLNAALGTYYGYEFQYWKTEDGEFTIPATMPAYDQEVTAYWDPVRSLLTVYSSLDPTQQLGYKTWMRYEEHHDTIESFNEINQFNFTDPNGEYEYLTPEGYVFVGYKYEDGTDMVFPYTHTLLEEVNIYAQFAPIEYTVTFMDGDNKYTEVTAGYGTAITLPENPVKEGSTFAGWVDADGNAVELSTMPLNGMTVYASWTVDSFKLNFFASEGDATAYKTFEITYGTELTAEYVAQLLAQITDPTKEGNTWNGWNTDAMPETMPAAAVNVYGSWTVNTYHIYWSVLDVSAGGTIVDTFEQSYLYGATMRFEYTAPEGYVILGFEGALETMPAEDLYRNILIDTKAYTITFDTDGGSAVESITARYKSAISAPAAPTKADYVFLGWSVDGVNMVEFPETMPLGGLNLKALWAPATVYITWIIEGVETIEEYAYGAAITAPEATKAADAKWTYKLTGWDAEIPATATENATFTAQFAEDEKVKYTVKFIDGENTVFETQIAWDGEITLDGFTAPTLTGSKLAWTVDGAEVSFPYAMTTADVTFVAAWTPITYTVYYYTTESFDNGMIPVYTAQAIYGAAFPAYELTVSEGYYFGHWATPNGMTYEFPETMPAEDLHLIGYVYPDSFNVQFKNGDDLVWNDFVEFNTSVYDALSEHIEAPEAAAGYTFAGWYDADGVKFDENYVMPAHAVVFTAKWTYTGWMEETDGTTYLVNDEKVYFNEWAEIDGVTYYFDANSYILKDIALLDNVYYAFDHETGAFLSDYTGIYEALNGDKYYVENGIAVKNKGLVKDVLSDGHIHYYYFGCADATCTDEACAGEYKAQRNCGHWAEITNGYLVLWGYQFDENGVIIHDEDTSKNGVHEDNGVKFYYIDGVKVHYGLFIGDDGAYYYAKSDGSLVTNREYWISASHINGLTYKGEAIVEGSYTFDEEGRIVWPSTEKNGVYIEDGKLYYYEAGLRTYAGLIKYTGKLHNENGDVIGTYNNDIIYVRGSGELAVGKYWPTKTNGLMESDTYQFDKSGKMMMLNGIIAEDGSLYYYVDGLRNYAGLIEIDGSFYYVRGTGEVVNNRSYWITKTNGLMDEGKFDFAADGKMIIPEPVAQKNGIYREDGKLMYYVDGKLNYAGLIQYTGDLIEEDGTVIKGVYQNAYIYVRGTGELVFGRSYWTTKHNDLMKSATYQFDDNGIMLNPAV